MEKKEGRYFIIDNVLGYRLIEVIFNDHPDTPVYKIYQGKLLVDKWRSNYDLHSMSAFDVPDSEDYTKYLNYIEKNSDEPIAYDMFGLPEESYIGTLKANREIKPKAKSSSTSKSNYGATNNYYRKGKHQYYPTVETTGLAEGLKNSDTLVIHCADGSTDMLSQLYEGKGWDVLRDGSIAESELHDLFKCHSKVVMLGHGSPSGLINVQRNKGGKRWTVVDNRFTEDLKDKKLFVIWCSADAFFDKIGIGQGQFITGNIPSETYESLYAGCGYISPNEMLENITYWSKLCADKIDACLNGNVKPSVDYIRRKYIERYGDHPVTRYNAIRSKVHGTSLESNEAEVDNIYKQLNKEIPTVDKNDLAYNYFNYKY